MTNIQNERNKEQTIRKTWGTKNSTGKHKKKNKEHPSEKKKGKQKKRKTPGKQS